jgi:hypothetical protein
MKRQATCHLPSCRLGCAAQVVASNLYCLRGVGIRFFRPVFLLSALFLGARLYDFGGGAHLGGFSTSLDDLLNMRLGRIGEGVHQVVYLRCCGSHGWRRWFQLFGFGERKLTKRISMIFCSRATQSPRRRFDPAWPLVSPCSESVSKLSSSRYALSSLAVLFLLNWPAPMGTISSSLSLSSTPKSTGILKMPSEPPPSLSSCIGSTVRTSTSSSS